MQDRATDALAAGAVLSPFVLPGLYEISEVAADWLPILGAAWLLVQIVAKIKTTFLDSKKS